MNSFNKKLKPEKNTLLFLKYELQKTKNKTLKFQKTKNKKR